MWSVKCTILHFTFFALGLELELGLVRGVDIAVSPAATVVAAEKIEE